MRGLARAVTAGLALALAAPAARAQPARAEASRAGALDVAVAEAVAALRTRRSIEALTSIARATRELGVDARGYEPLAVLYRVAFGRAEPGADTRGELGRAPPPAPNREGLPAPPSDELARARAIDGVVQRLARWDLAGAASFLDGSGLDDPTARALRAVAAAEETPRGAFTPLLPERPAGTMEGFEVLTVYGATTTYGFMLGTWAGLAATDSDRNALRIVLPLAGASAGIVGAIVLDRSRALRRGRGYAFNAGLTLGSLAGVSALVYAGSDTPFESWSYALGGATLGVGLALGVAHAVDALPGSASWVTTGGVWGSMVGLGIAVAAQGDALRARDAASAMLVGEGVGAVLAMLTARALRPTPGQTRWIDLGTLLGGTLGGSLGAAADSSVGAGIGMALGVLAGGAGAWFAARPSQADRLLYLQRSASRAPALRFALSPLPGGALVQVGL